MYNTNNDLLTRSNAFPASVEKAVCTPFLSTWAGRFSPLFVSILFTLYLVLSFSVYLSCMKLLIRNSLGAGSIFWHIFLLLCAQCPSSHIPLITKCPCGLNSLLNNSRSDSAFILKTYSVGWRWALVLQDSIRIPSPITTQTHKQKWL